MKKLSNRVTLRKNIYKKYQENLKGLSDITFFEHNFNYTTPWFIDCKVNRRKDLMDFLKSNNIGSRTMYPPINKQKAYPEFNLLNFPVSNLIGEKGLWLPSANQLSIEQIDFICDKIKQFYG
jgi:perosamine synthetase